MRLWVTKGVMSAGLTERRSIGSAAGGAYGGGAGGELQARLLHGRMDVIRAELVWRGAARDALALSPEEPARVFLGGPAEGGGP